MGGLARVVSPLLRDYGLAEMISMRGEELNSIVNACFVSLEGDSCGFY